MTMKLESYLSSLDGWPFEVQVDLAARERAPVAELPHRLHLRLELNHPTEVGLASAEEAALLSVIQEELLARVSASEAVLVAAVTHRKARTLVFYCAMGADTDGHPIQAAIDVVETHKTSLQSEQDPEWAEYLNVLYPDDNFLHQIKDRRVLKEFELRGDDCGEVHSIEPRFVGLTAEGAKGLASDLEKLGFDVKDMNESGLNGSREWIVTGIARSPLALPILDDFRANWINLARNAGGRYDGWSAEVVPVDGQNNNTGCSGHLFPEDND